jgi:hypothetical protein
MGSHASMVFENRPRRWRGPLLSLLLFVFLDFTAGTVLFRFVPYKSDNRHYRLPSPTYHHDLKPNAATWASWGPNSHRLYTNSLGFKDAVVRDIPLKSDAWRVVLLGDSFTEGLGYIYEDTYAGILHARLAPRGIEILNAGVVSYSPVIYYRKMKYLLEEVKLQVDEVIVFMDISDIHDEAVVYVLNADGSVVDHPPGPGVPIRTWTPMTRLDKVSATIREHFLSVAVFDRLRQRFAGKSEQSGENAPMGSWQKLLKNDRANWTHDARVFKAYGERGLEQAAQSMDRLQDLLRKYGARLTVVVYPWPNQIMARDLDSIQVRYWRAWAAAQGSGFVDLFGEFIDGNDPMVAIRKYYIGGDGHFNAAGHQHVAAAMLQKYHWTAGTSGTPNQDAWPLSKP